MDACHADCQQSISMNAVFCIQNSVTMNTTLPRLDAAPDLVEQVYRRLLDAISDGSLAPGSRITQEDIAEQLKVSRSPVLQAIQLLKKDGLLQDLRLRCCRLPWPPDS